MGRISGYLKFARPNELSTEVFSKNNSVFSFRAFFLIGSLSSQYYR